MRKVMMRPTELVVTTAIFASAVVLTGVLATASVNAANPPSQPVAAAGDRAVRGKYLVDIMGCHDCHTPWKIGPNGPEMDMSRALTGHPEGMTMPPAPALAPGPWIGTVGATMTAWSGPWGTSFTMNLTPDKETGLGDWTEEQFIATMKTGRDRGKGRPLLPPMPYFNLGKLSDEDIRSVFAYLQSLPPVKNRVPQPIDPPEPGTTGGGQR
jgi:mono/diheme cytochrome c family protein